MNVWLLDKNTAVGLARSGILLRSTDKVFLPATVDELTSSRSEAQLQDYLALSHRLTTGTARGH